MEEIGPTNPKYQPLRVLWRPFVRPHLKNHPLAGMCPGLGEWWLHKGVLNFQNLISMLNLCRFLVDTLF